MIAMSPVKEFCFEYHMSCNHLMINGSFRLAYFKEQDVESYQRSLRILCLIDLTFGSWTALLCWATQ